MSISQEVREIKGFLTSRLSVDRCGDKQARQHRPTHRRNGREVGGMGEYIYMRSGPVQDEVLGLKFGGDGRTIYRVLWIPSVQQERLPNTSEHCTKCVKKAAHDTSQVVCATDASVSTSSRWQAISVAACWISV